MSDRPRYTLEIEAQPGDVPPEHRLRRLLKSMLRAYGMRCTRITRADDPPASPPPPVSPCPPTSPT